MASIFNIIEDPPRVSSPWATPPSGSYSKHAILQDFVSDLPQARMKEHQKSSAAFRNSDIDYSTITRLDAEPQEGPTEYKLHLLLKRRRSFTYTSTGRHTSGSLRRAEAPASSSVGRSVSDTGLLSSATPPSSFVQSRQQRLYHLTNQLLWRLQQSCPNHSHGSTTLVLPRFPNEADLSASTVLQPLIPGLEESKGALYEIGIADDGTFVGLAEDEMEESLNNLRAMGASLGCRVDVLRMVPVGECRWAEDAGLPGSESQHVRESKLWVAEALVRPDQQLVDRERVKTIEQDPKLSTIHATSNTVPGLAANDEREPCEQLRVSLTGATMSGKSTLLGCLSTATLDNGRGKSRLSLLKHLHEIESGMTSSVTQELIGYRDISDVNGTGISSQVVNFGVKDVEQWVDIHATTGSGRLVLLSDSAGHPRFRRTTVRGLVGWDPHWTLLCIPADNTENSSGKIGASPSAQEILGSAAADVDLSQAHLELCLNLGLPLVVVITKLDIATKTGLRQSLARLLSTLKEAGRKPCMISDPSNSISEADLNLISAHDLLEANRTCQLLISSPLETVPIILTSALKGTGIKKLHALLRKLPIPDVLESSCPGLSTLFHIEDIYTNMQASLKALGVGNAMSDRPAVIGGHLRYGTLRVGDELMLGPYPAEPSSDDSDSGSGRGSTPPNRSHRASAVPASRSFPGAHKGYDLRSRPYAKSRQAEWRRVRITSIRNLRLPVRSLHAGQVGTIGITPLDATIASPALVRIRKGMILSYGEPNANRIISVRFVGRNAEAVQSLTVGSAVVAYVASVRASAKVVSLAADTSEGSSTQAQSTFTPEDDDGAFGFGFDDEDEGHVEQIGGLMTKAVVVTFQFLGSREFVESGATVLVLPGGGPGLYGGTERGEKGVAGLEGFVGHIVD